MVERPVPAWLSKYLDPANIPGIEAAVAQAEERTSGEIVPMVVRRSSTIGHAAMTLFCAVWLLFLLAEVAFDLHLWLGLEAFATHLMLPLLSIAVSRLLLLHDGVTRLLVSDDDRELQVWNRAELEFYRANLNHTVGGTGVLIFVSLFEHRVVVLGDKAISDRIPTDTWKTVVDHVIAAIKMESLALGLQQAAIDVGEILARHFPRNPDDHDELHNKLIIKE